MDDLQEEILQLSAGLISFALERGDIKTETCGYHFK
jgi:hypothetical protein